MAALAGSATADDVCSERVQFQHGASGAVVEDSLTGYETVDYLLGAAAGQVMSVNLATDNGASYFRTQAPGEDAVALLSGSIDGNMYEGVLSESGDYTERV